MPATHKEHKEAQTLNSTSLDKGLILQEDSQQIILWNCSKLYKKLRVEFYTQLIRRGVFLQPYHHGYIMYRHSDADLDHIAQMIEESLAETKKLL